MIRELGDGVLGDKDISDINMSQIAGYPIVRFPNFQMSGFPLFSGSFRRYRQRQHTHGPRSGVFEHTRRFGGGRPGRQQIVDEQYVLVLEVFKFSYCKSALYICPALFFVQKTLGIGVADAPQMILSGARGIENSLASPSASNRAWL